MSLPDRAPPRKPRRLGLYLPFALLLAALVGWSGFWVWARGEAAARMDAAVATLKSAGYEVSWRERDIGGYPFRINVTLTEPRVREPSGWALAAPRLEGQAYMHAPDMWMLAAPEGLTFTRPIGGPVAVKGRIIRASLSHLGRAPPDVSFEGLDLTFQPGAGATPFALQAAKRVEFHLRAGPNDEGLVSGKVDEGKAMLTGLLGQLAGEKPISIVWTSTLSKLSALRGPDWPGAVRSWSAAGGRISVREAGLTAGEAVIGANSGTLGVDNSGRLSGVLEVSLRQAPRALGTMGQTGVIPQETAAAAAAVAQARQGVGEVARATLNFQAGRTTLGPVALAPAPKVFEP